MAAALSFWLVFECGEDCVELKADNSTATSTKRTQIGEAWEAWSFGDIVFFFF